MRMTGYIVYALRRETRPPLVDRAKEPGPGRRPFWRSWTTPGQRTEHDNTDPPTICTRDAVLQQPRRSRLSRSSTRSGKRSGRECIHHIPNCMCEWRSQCRSSWASTTEWSADGADSVENRSLGGPVDGREVETILTVVEMNRVYRYEHYSSSFGAGHNHISLHVMQNGPLHG
ncbi:hypothetical protein PDE_05834 [Penicillium oxalicum 114-2]|uniref:Uncharacterized protein n=1 Tax=Penicillium oxalicum (strain 114-2 / CGMCC 5302) TaxID=933388 RepID=S8B847_PENO1|nr:hypothetical protein PDE_05834 [Penicillium oxalicum 114-2]